MSHLNRNHDNLELNHDSTSKLPSKSSQPPIAMSRAGILDHDSRVTLAKRYRTQWASAPAAMVSVIAGSPMENIKTRMQSRYFVNALECIRYTHRTEGLRGFWAGTTTPLISLTLTRVAGFTVYQKAKYALDAVIQDATGRSPLKLVNTPGTYPDLAVITCFTTAGAISGVALAFLIAPFELIKNATQTSILMASNMSPRGPPIGSVSPERIDRVSSWNACKQIVQRRGFLGLYTGFQLHLTRDLVGSGIYFGVYEATKQAITTYSGADKPNTLTAITTAGWLCGILSWVVTYPLDTMKTRAQNMLVGEAARFAEKVGRDAVASASRTSKWKGIEMIILRSSVQNMIQMTIFEYVKMLINGLQYSDGSTELPKKNKKTKSKENKSVGSSAI